MKQQLSVYYFNDFSPYIIILILLKNINFKLI